MNYAPPDHAPLCRCRASPIAATFCPTGHMTECHYPLTCDQAACGHLPRYDDYAREHLDQLVKQAQQRLRTMADAACQKCAGTGLLDVTIRTDMPTPDFLKEHIAEPTLSFSAKAICACTAEPRPDS